MSGSAYSSCYAEATNEPERFWAKAASAIDWHQAPVQIFDGQEGPYGRWFPDAMLNACHNAVDRHAIGARAGQVAIRYESSLTHDSRSISFSELRDEVAILATLLSELGVEKGDRVLLYMPMIPETIIGMLACARLGAVHSVVFGGFASNELAARIEDAQPTVILSASCGIEPTRIVAYKPLLESALAKATHFPQACLVLQRVQCEAALGPRDYDWSEAVERVRGQDHRVGCVPVMATDPLYILYTSGTTGKPKGVVRDTGGYLVALSWTMANLYGLRPGETFFCASDVGWVVGHSYIVYGPLTHGCTTVLYEGKPVGTPDAKAFWRVAASTGAACLFTAPTAIRAIKREDADGDGAAAFDLSRLRSLFLAGERADPDTVAWVSGVLNRPVVDHWWQTETGWAITGNPLGLEAMPVKPGRSGVPMPGYRIDILDEDGRQLPKDTIGTIAVRLPLPPGCFPTLWQNDERMRSNYLSNFPGYYNTCDAGMVDDDGYITVLGRTDDIINVAGHRISTSDIEVVLAGHPAVAECAVVGLSDAIKGELPWGFIVLKANVTRDHALIERELIEKVRNAIGPVAAFKQTIIVQRLPKTRSGKILRGTIKSIGDNRPWTVPSTIDEPDVLDEIIKCLQRVKQVADKSTSQATTTTTSLASEPTKVSLRHDV